MDITAETIEKIQSLIPVNDRIKKIDGRIYTYGKFSELRMPKLETMRLSTLDGFIEFANSREDRSKLIVTIDSQEHVSLRSANVDKDWNNYDLLAIASASEFISDYKYGRSYDAEEFMIRLQTGFIITPARDNLIKVAGNMSGESESKIEDDGVTQSTTVGRAVKTKVTIKNPVELKPVRTFQEVEQVSSPFIFRIDDDMNLTLHTGDSGKWKLAAIKEIAKYLRGNLNEIKVYA